MRVTGWACNAIGLLWTKLKLKNKTKHKVGHNSEAVRKRCPLGWRADGDQERVWRVPLVMLTNQYASKNRALLLPRGDLVQLDWKPGVQPGFRNTTLRLRKLQKGGEVGVGGGINQRLRLSVESLFWSAATWRERWRKGDGWKSSCSQVQNCTEGAECRSRACCCDANLLSFLSGHVWLLEKSWCSVMAKRLRFRSGGCWFDSCFNHELASCSLSASAFGGW